MNAMSSAREDRAGKRSSSERGRVDVESAVARVGRVAAPDDDAERHEVREREDDRRRTRASTTVLQVRRHLRIRTTTAIGTSVKTNP